MSEVILDTITGKSTATTITIGSTPVVSASANSMTIRGEGTAQTSIQQGLAKAWSTTSADGETINNSFNIATLTDVGTGQQQHNVTNNFANTNHVPTFSVANSYNQQWTSNLATSSWRTNNYGAGYVDIEMRTLTLGDLA